ALCSGVRPLALYALGGTHQPPNPLSQRAVETLNVTGLASKLGERLVLSSGNDPRVDCIVIRVERSALLIRCRNLFPEGLSTLATAVPDLASEDVPRRSGQGTPDPVTVRLLPHTAPELVPLGL